MNNQAMIDLAHALVAQLLHGARLWLFLDYDGTLADFAPNPDILLPDPDLIGLISRLVAFPDCLRVVIMSGRRYSHIAALLPIPGVLEAGTYGVEFKTWEGEQVCLLDFENERPFLDQVKADWSALIGQRPGYYLEDKGYSLALHARNAPDKEARETLAEAAQMANAAVERGAFRILGGNKFIEVAPTIADKGQSVSTLLKRFPWPAAQIVYFGDDDKDEEAFDVVLKLGGTPILVSAEERPTAAQHRLSNPAEVRAWLSFLAEGLEQGDSVITPGENTAAPR